MNDESDIVFFSSFILHPFPPGVFSEFSGRNGSRVEGDKRTDWERAVKVLPGYFGRCDRRTEKSLVPCR
jgi:hypothetical protein